MGDIRNIAAIIIGSIILAFTNGCSQDPPPGFIKITIRGMKNIPNQVVVRTNGYDSLRIVVHDGVIDAETNWQMPLAITFSKWDTTDAPTCDPSLTDTDGDCIPDSIDACDDQWGLADTDPLLNGCPDSKWDTTGYVLNFAQLAPRPRNLY